jgi:hypothetical protein
MKKLILQRWMFFVFGFAASLTTAAAQETPGIEGAWKTQVHLFNCKNGVGIADIRALNLFMHDGSFTETAVNILRTPSVGTWQHIRGRSYVAKFWFYRYTSNFTFASFAAAVNNIELDGDHFTITGQVVDTFADGSTATTCVQISGDRLQ